MSLFPCTAPPTVDGTAPRVWRSGMAVRADRQHVLDALTEVDACQAWAPVDFNVDAPDIARLLTGTRVAVSGALAGQRVRFCVDVFAADAEGLLLRARGPVDLTAHYEVHELPGGSQVEAAIAVRHGSGRLGGTLARVTSGLLAGGALNRTLRRMADEAERRQRSDDHAPGRAA